MKNQTRKTLLNIATAVAVAATATVVLLPNAVMAATRMVNANANVRATPGGPVIGTLAKGTIVEVVSCTSWCELESGGYISANLLSRAPGGGGGAVVVNPPDVGVSIGAGGISIGIGTPGFDEDDDDFAEACFYTRTRYRGDSFCMEEGESIRRLGVDWNDEISSIENPDGLRVTVCIDRNYRDCRTYTSSARSLGAFDDEISSIRVRD